MFEDKTTIIGIAGGTGSGKTTVVKKIVEALPPHYVAVVPLDSYYNDTSHMTDEERHAINFDHPDAFDDDDGFGLDVDGFGQPVAL